YATELPVQSRRATDVPPIGTIWFGHSFDATTFAISGRISTVGVGEPFSFVAHLPRGLNASELIVREWRNGKLVATRRANSTGEGDIWGFSSGPRVETGQWRFDLTDLGGKILATGTITAT